MFKRELAIAFILIVGILAPIISLFPSAEAGWPPEEQTVHIVDTHDDRWITELGRHFDSPLVQILDPTSDLTSYLIFRNVSINFWEPLTNATLRLYTTSNQSFDDSSVTIYGMKVDELQTISVSASFVLSVPYTSAYVNYNTSLFSGSKWHDIDVTAIVEELIRSHNWDGVDYPGDVGDAIGFIILGAKGSDPRWFQDYRSYPPNSADLVIHWNHQPPLTDPPNDYEFIEQYRNYTIWQEIPSVAWPLEPMEYMFQKTLDLRYGTLDAPNSSVRIVVVDDYAQPLFPNRRTLTRDSNGTLYAVYHKEIAGEEQIYCIKSINNGTTWIDATHISTLAGMADYDQVAPSIAVDGDDELHVVFRGRISGENNQIYYVKYTDSWSTPIRLSTHVDIETQGFPALALDSDDNVHVVWGGVGETHPTYQVWYSKYTTGWSSPLRLSTYTDMEDAKKPSIEIDGSDNIHVAFEAKASGFPVFQVWYVKYTDSWSTPIRLSTVIDAEGFGQQYPSIAIDSLGYVHIVWPGVKPTGSAVSEIWYVKYTDSWSTPIRISNATGMDVQHQNYASIAIDSLDYVHILWNGKATGYLDDDKLWYVNYTTTWNMPPFCIQPVGLNEKPHLRWSRWPYAGVGAFLIADLNGTIIENDCPDVNCSRDKIDIIMGFDPVDPDPPGWEDVPVAFSRFRMRLYFLIIGYGCVWGPIWFFCWKRPSGYYIGVAFIIMLMGLGLLLQIPNV